MTEPTDWAAKRAALPERWTGTGLKPMSAFEMAAAVHRDSLIGKLDVPVSMYDLAAYDRRGLLNLVAALLDREAEARRDLEQRLAEARDFLVLKEWGHVGPDHIPWFTHGAISHAADAACVICRWLAPHDATATPEAGA